MPESYEHKFLKEIAMIWLRDQGYLWLGTEIDIGWKPLEFLKHLDEKPTDQTSIDEYMKRYKLDGWRMTWQNRRIIDCIGFKRWYPYTRAASFWACGIEAKLSRQDYLTGFCYDRLNTHYIIAPKAVIPKSTLPKRVGLLEVKDVSIDQYGKVLGISITKRPRSIHVEIEHLESMIRSMCRHTSLEYIRALKTQLPSKRKPQFRTARLPEIST